VVALQAEGDLLHVVLAAAATGRLPNLLDGRQEEPDEDGDDGDHDQQLDQRKRGPASRERTHSGTS